MKPNFEHDCEKCVFLGRMESSLSVFPDFVPCDLTWEQVYSTDSKKDIDLYFCDQHGHPTVIARFSSDGPDYISGLALCEHDPHLMAAKNLASAKGLLE